MSKSELLGKVKGLLGGRAAEEIAVGEISTGASNDIERATKIVIDMVTVLGMSQNIPKISLVNDHQNYFFGQELGISKRSDNMEQTIDEEVTSIIQQCYDAAKELLVEKKDKLNEMASLLLQKEVLTEEDVNRMLTG